MADLSSVEKGPLPHQEDKLEYGAEYSPPATEGEAGVVVPQTNALARDLQGRHMQMIAIGMRVLMVKTF